MLFQLTEIYLFQRLIPFLIGVLLVFWSVRILYQVLRDYQIGKSSTNWPSVEGKIVATKLANDRGNFRRFISAKVQYSYSLGGNTFRASGIGKSSYGIRGTRKYIQSVINKYPIGSKVKVYYHPKKHNSLPKNSLNDILVNQKYSLLEPGTPPLVNISMRLALALIIYFFGLFYISLSPGIFSSFGIFF